MNLPGDDEGQQKAFIRPLLLRRPIVVAQGKRFVSLKKKKQKRSSINNFPTQNGRGKESFFSRNPFV